MPLCATVVCALGVLIGLGGCRFDDGGVLCMQRVLFVLIFFF
jgi:hypothetical protein